MQDRSSFGRFFRLNGLIWRNLMRGFAVSLSIVALIATTLLFAAEAEAKSKKKKKKSKINPALVFDGSKRKRTKTQLNDAVSFSGFVGLRVQDEQNLKLGDFARDRRYELSVIAGLYVKAKISDRAEAFTHLEFDARNHGTESTTNGTETRLRVKEALLTYDLGDGRRLTLGRMRFSDVNRWVADASVDGIHWSYRSKTLGYEVALFREVFNDRATYLLGHVATADKRQRQGVFAIAEAADDGDRLHVSGYRNRMVSDRLSYAVSLGGVVGDAANGKRAGLGFDFRGTYKLRGEGNPQITFGLAGGTPGFRQTNLHTNKTYDGGQAQFHGYGYAFQPELGNLLVGSLNLGLRPSRKFSVDFGGHVYFQPQTVTIGPDARITGPTNGQSAFVGTELSLKGAWRISKKTKFEFGVAGFQPGPAFDDRSSSKRAYARVNFTF